MIKFYKKFVEPLQKFKKNFCKFWRKCLKTLTTGENVKCDEILMKICKNSTKKRNFSGNFG